MAKPKEVTQERSAQAPTKNSHAENQELMKAIGAPSYNPAPPDQTSWPMKQPGMKPAVRLASWLFECTLAFKPGRRRSIYAVDDQGNELHIEDACRHFGWDLANGRKYWNEVKLRGIGRSGNAEEGRRRLYICGVVNPVNNLQEILDSNEQEKQGGRTEDEKGLRKPFSLYLRRQIEQLPADKQAAVIDRLNAKEEKVEKLRADLEEALQTIGEREEDSIFAEFGIRKIRIPLEKRKKLDPERAAALAERSERIKPLLPVLKTFAQTFFDFGEAGPEKVYVNPKNGFTETSASLLNTENFQRGESSPVFEASSTENFQRGASSPVFEASSIPETPPAAAAAAAVPLIVAAVENAAGAGTDFARKVWDKAAEARPDIQADEAAALVAGLWQAAKSYKNVSSPLGLIITKIGGEVGAKLDGLRAGLKKQREQEQARRAEVIRMYEGIIADPGAPPDMKADAREGLKYYARDGEARAKPDPW